MAEQAIRTNKTSKIKALLFFLALAGIDAGMLLFAGSSKVGFFTEIGLKKGLFLLGANVVIVVLIVFQNKIREKVCNTRWIKVCNIAVLFVTPVIILLLVQMIINAGVYEMQTEYFSKNIILYYILYIIFFDDFSESFCFCFSLYYIPDGISAGRLFCYGISRQCLFYYGYF